MPLSPEQTHALVWTEVRDLQAADLSDLGLLAGAIAGVVTARNGEGFKATPLPAQEGEERTRSDLVGRAVTEAASGSVSGRTLPRSAVLWEVDAQKRPLESREAIPPDLAWIKEADAQALGIYQGVPGGAADARRFVLFAPVNDGFSGPPVFVSGLTRTGIDLPVLPPIQVSRHKRIVAWILGLVSLAIFCVAAYSVYSAGRRVGDGLALLNGSMIGYAKLLDGAYASIKKQQAPLPPPVPKAADTPALGGSQPSQGAPAAPPAPDADAAAAAAAAKTSAVPSGSECIKLFGTVPGAPRRAAAGVNDDDCLGLWAAAMSIVTRKPLSEQSDPYRPGHEIGKLRAAWLSIQGPMIVMMLSVVGLAIAAGLALMGRTTGILINNVYRMSLARFQVVAWSVLILPTVIAFACFNAGMIGEALQLGTSVDALGVVASTASEKLVVFPVFPPEILGALGISVVSTMLSPLILTTKESGADTLQVIAAASRVQNARVSTFGDAPTRLAANPSPADASISDLLLGEERGNRGEVDISRLQMLVITIGLVFTYMSLIFGLAGRIHISDIGRAADSGQSLFAALPPAGYTFLILLAISHSAYLITKSVDKPVPPVHPPTTPPTTPAATN